MAADDDTFETLAAPAQRTPARTAASLAGAGVVTIIIGAVLLVLTVGLFDNSLVSANERGTDRARLLAAEVSPGSTAAVNLDGDRAKTLLAILEPNATDDMPGDELDIPTVRVGAPDGSTVPVRPTEPVELTINDGRRTIAIGQFRTGDPGVYEVQVAAGDGDTLAVGVTDDLLPDPGDLGGAAGTFLASAAAATLLGIGALLCVLGLAWWLWFRFRPADP